MTMRTELPLVKWLYLTNFPLFMTYFWEIIKNTLDIICVMCYYDNSRQMMVCFLSRIRRQEANHTNESKSDGVPRSDGVRGQGPTDTSYYGN